MIHMSNHGHVSNIPLFVHDLTDLVYGEVHLQQRENTMKRCRFLYKPVLTLRVTTGPNSACAINAKRVPANFGITVVNIFSPSLGPHKGTHGIIGKLNHSSFYLIFSHEHSQ